MRERSCSPPTHPHPAPPPPRTPSTHTHTHAAKQEQTDFRGCVLTYHKLREFCRANGHKRKLRPFLSSFFKQNKHQRSLLNTNCTSTAKRSSLNTGCANCTKQLTCRFSVHPQMLLIVEIPPENPVTRHMTYLIT